MLKSFVSESDYENLIKIFEDIYNGVFENKTSILIFYGEYSSGKSTLTKIISEFLNIINPNTYNHYRINDRFFDDKNNDFPINDNIKFIFNENENKDVGKKLNKINNIINEGFYHRNRYESWKFIGNPPTLITTSLYKNNINNNKRKKCISIHLPYKFKFNKNIYETIADDSIKEIMNYIKEKNARKASITLILIMRNYFYKDLSVLLGKTLYETKNENVWEFKTE